MSDYEAYIKSVQDQIIRIAALQRQIVDLIMLGLPEDDLADFEKRLEAESKRLQAAIMMTTRKDGR